MSQSAVTPLRAQIVALTVERGLRFTRVTPSDARQRKSCQWRRRFGDCAPKAAELILSRRQMYWGRTSGGLPRCYFGFSSPKR